MRLERRRKERYRIWDDSIAKQQKYFNCATGHNCWFDQNRVLRQWWWRIQYSHDVNHINSTYYTLAEHIFCVVIFCWYFAFRIIVEYLKICMISDTRAPTFIRHKTSRFKADRWYFGACVCVAKRSVSAKWCAAIFSFSFLPFCISLNHHG